MDKVNRVMITSFSTNILLALLKVIAGILGGSGALIADGIHSFSDMLRESATPGMERVYVRKMRKEASQAS